MTIRCLCCGEEVNELVARCPECGADPRTGTPGPGFSAGSGMQPGWELFDGQCPVCFEDRLGARLVDLRLKGDGFAAPWGPPTDMAATADDVQVGESVLRLKMVVCFNCSAVCFRMPAPAEPDEPGV
jgi:hypothetical protein